MISEIRNYLRARIACVDPDLKEIDDPVGDDDLSTARLDKSFKIYFSALSGEAMSVSFTDSFQATIEIYRKSDRRVIPSFDALYEKAIQVRNACVSPVEARNKIEFVDILTSSITVSPLNTNDKTFKSEITLTFRRDFSFN